MASALAKYQLLGDLRPEEYAALKADIEKRGVLVPVEADEDGNILDGHNRVAIADTLGKPYKTITRRFKTEGEKREHVIKLNLARRHLDGYRWGQAFKMLAEERGIRRGKGKGDPHAAESKTATVAVLAEELGVSDRTARHRVAQADYYEALPKSDRKAIDEGKKTFQEVKKESKKRERRKKRAKRLKAIADVPPLAKGPRCSVILCDPPWRYDYSPTDSREIENQYPTMPLEDICGMAGDVQKRATPNAILFLWATSPKLREALAVLEAWGFTYRTAAVWDKEKIGMGYYFRQQHEFLLVATRGEFPSPLEEHRPASIFRSPRAKHSEKPECVYIMIETAYPQVKRLEMFQCKTRKGWYGWGTIE